MPTMNVNTLWLPATKDLHAEEGKDEDEEHEEDQQGNNGGDRVHQGLDKVTHGRPVSRKEIS